MHTRQLTHHTYELVFNNLARLSVLQNSFLQTLDRERCEELLVRLLVYPGWHVLDNVELAVHLKSTCHS